MHFSPADLVRAHMQQRLAEASEYRMSARARDQRRAERMVRRAERAQLRAGRALAAVMD